MSLLNNGPVRRVQCVLGTLSVSPTCFSLKSSKKCLSRFEERYSLSFALETVLSNGRAKDKANQYLCHELGLCFFFFMKI